MSVGTRWPLPATKSPERGRRMALLWPEEDPGSDRITNQLMFVPPPSSAGDSSSQKIKMLSAAFAMAILTSFYMYILHQLFPW